MIQGGAMKLHKYWFKFSLSMNDPHPIGTLMGCGVTASSRDEALELLRALVFRSHPMPSIEKCIEDVKISDLDTKHVLPNMGDCSQRGIWFPMGYESNI
jgi:hypothetical protein